MSEGGLLSAALIVRDEEDVLADCLQSIRGVVDEIVVVDTGSVDRSPAIAREFGAVVYSRPWDDDFAAARNAALDRCGGAWILYIDADEQLAEVSRAQVEDLLVDAPEVAFRLLLRPSTRTTPYREYRLWRNDPRIRFEGVIHEKVVPSIQAVAEADGRPIGVCDLLLTHRGYEGDQTHKHRRNLPLLERQLTVESDNLFNWHHLATVLTGLGRAEEAEDALVHAVAVGKEKPATDPAGVLAEATLIALRLERGDDVGSVLADARARYPGNYVLLWLEAKAHAANGRYEEAMVCFEQLLRVDPSGLPDAGPSYDERLFGEFAHDGRAVCLFRLGRHGEAAAAWAEAEACSSDPLAYRVKAQLATARSGGAGPGAPT